MKIKLYNDIKVKVKKAIHDPVTCTVCLTDFNKQILVNKERQDGGLKVEPATTI